MSGFCNFLTLLGLGTLGILIKMATKPSMGSASVVPLMVIGVITICVFLYLVHQLRLSSEKSKRIRKAQGALTDGRRPLLLLRSFTEDREAIQNDSTQFASRVTTGMIGALGSGTGYAPGNEETTFEDYLEQLFVVAGPTVAIGRPGEKLPPPGFSRLYVSHETWQDCVKELLRICHRVVVIMSEIAEDTGLVWELQRIFELSDPEKVMLILPPAMKEKAAKKRWEGCRRFSNDKMPEYTGGAVAVRFEADWTPVVITASKGLLYGYDRSLESYFQFVPKEWLGESTPLSVEEEEVWLRLFPSAMTEELKNKLQQRCQMYREGGKPIAAETLEEIGFVTLGLGAALVVVGLWLILSPVLDDFVTVLILLVLSVILLLIGQQFPQVPRKVGEAVLELKDRLSGAQENQKALVKEVEESKEPVEASALQKDSDTPKS